MFTTFVEVWATPLLFFSMTFTFMLMCLPTRHHPSNDEKKRVVVLVLGDIGRSPRMQHHCLSLARKGAIVDLVGYEESLPRPELLENTNIHRYPLPVPPKLFNTSTPLTFLIFAPFKAFFQFTSLLYCLLYVIPPSAGYILLQNPPAIPTLIVTQFVSKLRMQKVVIDWHNFGWSILMMKFNEHPIVWFCKFYEKVFGRAAYANFTVTKAMTKVLKDDMGIKAPIRTLYDRPPMHFIPLDAAAKKEFLESHPATKRHADAVLSGKTKMITSSTSWTQDEDFSQLLAAFLSYDSYASGANFLKPGSAPSILAIITGKGPLKEGYMATIEKLEFQFITVETVWLESADYPKMIACADLGISLHTSTSGVDLPMKIVDLFGVGVPVAAFGFYSLRELVKHRENGIVFKDGQDLGENLKTLFNPSSRELERLKMGAMKETHDRWDENWDNIAAPVFGL